MNIISASRIKPILTPFIIFFVFSVCLAHADSIYYSIQIGAYKNQKNAVEELNQLAGMGYGVFILGGKTNAKHPLYRVYLGSFSSKSEAGRQARELIKAGTIQDYLIKRLKGGFQSDMHQKSGGRGRNDLPPSSLKHRSDFEIEEGRAYYDLGVFAFEDGDYAQAEQNFKRALAYKPDHPFYNHYLGKTYLKEKRYEEAGKHLQAAWDGNPNIPELKYDLAFLNYKTANYSRAADLFSEISEEAPNYVLAQYYAGISFYQRQRYGQAVGYFLSAAEKSPSIRENGYYYAGLCYLKRGETDKAADLLVSVRDTGKSERLQNNASNWLWAIAKHREIRKPYSLYFKLGFGYDSNVI